MLLKTESRKLMWLLKKSVYIQFDSHYWENGRRLSGISLAVSVLFATDAAT